MQFAKAVEPGGELASWVPVEAELGWSVPGAPWLSLLTSQILHVTGLADQTTRPDKQPDQTRPRCSPDVSARQPGWHLRPVFPGERQVVELRAGDDCGDDRGHGISMTCHKIITTCGFVMDV